ncbi:hypothetical protein MHM83_04305 [Tenacibaculum sp. Mcav3-52]|uniref:hypothetical protein n=1 Tax=Tenacibaculum sp. Mcav3-52 TaxID=2917762 RepID=UPI001EF24F90|nr:hypothetical protein [Tenacibaculum sp. Mcav3-52]MCG7501084.1 hypothetical protein [Tenacibaculum sp. Mcav3-52]
MKYIENAKIIDKTSHHLLPNHKDFNNLDDFPLELDIEFAMNLSLGEVIWLDNEELWINDYPYILNITEELLEKWSSGWYQIVSKIYIGKTIEFEVIETNCKETKNLLHYDFSRL